MNLELLEALESIEKEKGVSREVLLQAIEAALVSAYKRHFTTALGGVQNVSVEIDRETGQIDVFAHKTVVEQLEDERTEISLVEAKAMDPRYQLEDEVFERVTPKNFGRIAAQTAKQVVVQRIREAERGIIYESFLDKEDDIITGLVQRWEQKNLLIDLGKTEAILPPAEQMPNEIYKQGERIKVYVMEVKRTTKGPQIFVSRNHSGLLKRLFELEVPEIYDGTVEIKSVSREAGQRSKIAVSSRDSNVDPVGACVGPKGVRVQNVVNELKGEKIDIVKWDEDPEKYVANALSPSKVTSVLIREANKVASVVVPDYQLSLAIGKEGQNARLAAKLTNWKIDIKSESQAAEAVKESQPVVEEEEVIVEDLVEEVDDVLIDEEVEAVDDGVEEERSE